MNASKNPMKLDANESAFFKRELEYVKSRTYDTKYKQLKAMDIIPVSTEANNGATEITYQKFTAVGFAKIISDYANDFPRVDVYGTETTAKIKGVGASYGYSIKEIRSSQYSGKRLDQRRADVARRAIEEKINSIALDGDANCNISGLLDVPGFTEYTVPSDGTGTTKTWSTKTADQIVRDVSGMVSAVLTVTNGREIPDTLLLPIAQYTDIANRRMSSVSDITILQYILKNSPHIKRIDWLTELYHAGAGGSIDRMIVGAFDDLHITLEIPQPFEQFDPQARGMAFEIPCHAETAGIIVYYPLAFAFGDGI